MGYSPRSGKESDRTQRSRTAQHMGLYPIFTSVTNQPQRRKIPVIYSYKYFLNSFHVLGVQQRKERGKISDLRGLSFS